MNAPGDEAFRPVAGLRGPLLQATLASKRPVHWQWRRRGLDLNARSSEHILECSEGVRLSGRMALQSSGKSRGLVVLIHGWEGCHDSSYLYSMASRLFQEGYDIFRLNLRDHGGTHHLNHQMFHSARIQEVLDAVLEIQSLAPGRPLFMVGFSLGGNFVLRVALRGPAMGIQPRLCVAISPSINPGATLHAIDDGPGLLRRYFLNRWRQTLAAKKRAWPDYEFSQFNRFTTFVEVTRAFVEGYTEWPDCDAYLASYTLTPAQLRDSPSPIALLTARDDSVIPIRDFEGLEPGSSIVAAHFTDHGGHCGFIRDWRLQSWAEDRVADWLDRCA